MESCSEEPAEIGDLNVVKATQIVILGAPRMIDALSKQAGEQHRRTAEALKYSESRYRSLVEHSPVGVWETTHNGETLYLNRAMCDLLEIASPADMVGKTFRDFYSAESIACVEREHAKRRRGEASIYTVEILGARRTRRELMIHGAPVVAPNGAVSSFIATILDITKEKEAERREQLAHEEIRRLHTELELRVAERTRELRMSTAQLEAFCYSISHDLKAPLRAICAFAEILEEDLCSTVSLERLRGLQAIASSARKMDQLLKDLLDFSRLANCQLQLTPVQTRALLHRVVNAAAAERKETFITVVDPVPDLLAHESALEQIFVNLIANAQKFVREGVPSCIRIYAEISGSRARIYVEDNGIGIASEHRDRIFRAFERLHRAEEFAGTGLGLAIVKTYIEKMRGKVGVESTPGSGSRFWIELPVANAHSEPEAVPGIDDLR